MTLLTLAKHLAGRHNQKNHGRRRGGSVNYAGTGIDILDADAELRMVSDVLCAVQNRVCRGSEEDLERARRFLYDAYVTSYGVYNTTITSVFPSADGAKVRISGEIHDHLGELVGEYTRYIDGQGTVTHDLFYIDNPKQQGTGFGSHFYQQSEEAYVKAGFKQVALQANLDVGGYAWARMGFDLDPNFGYENLVGLGDVYDKLDNMYADRYGISAPKGLPVKPYALAAYTGPDGYPIGKYAMLGSNWYGLKSLDTNSEAYKVGKMYYESKKQKKRANA